MQKGGLVLRTAVFKIIQSENKRKKVRAHRTLGLCKYP